MKDTINGWAVNIYPYERNKENNSRAKGHDYAKFKLYKCLDCNNVWEQVSQPLLGLVPKYYKDFPSYGMERKNCPKCDKSI